MIRRKIPRNVIAWSGLLCVLGWIMNLGYLSGQEDSIRRDFRNDALLSARLMTNQSDTIIQSIQSRFAVLETVIGLNGITLRQAVERGIVSMEHLVLLTLTDEHGRTVETNKGIDSRAVDLSDREHVAVQLEGQERGVFIGKPVIGRISKSWSIQVTSAVRTEEGRITGVLVASLDPFYFARFWSDAFLRSDSFVEMFGDDGILRTTSRNLPQQLEDGKADLELVAAAAQAEEGQVTVTRMGERYLSFFRRSKYFNTISVVRVSEAQLQARIAAVRLRHLAGGAFVTFVFLIGSAGLLASMRREEQTRQRAELAESRLRAAIRSMPVGFAMFDRHGRLVTQNASFEFAYGDGNTPAARRFAELRASSDPAGVTQTGTVELQPSPGVWTRLYEVPIPDGGLICFSVPITDLKRRERDLVASQYMLEANQAQLTSLMQEAQAADRMKSRFLAMMSHELRTPLTAVVGFSELLRDEPMTAEARLFADQIDECARSLLAIIDDVFDITKIGAQPTKVNGTSIDVPRMLQSLTDVARLLVRSEAVSVGLEIDPSIPATIFSDEMKIRQCLLNFISNAARHTNVGRIDIIATCRDDRIEFVVRDTGGGIAEERLARLFQPLDDIATKRDLSKPGLGLGLAISKRLADIMGASIRAESEMGFGSTLTLSVPLAAVPNERVPALQEKASAQAGELGWRILIADDAPSTRLLLSTMLKKLGHQVTAVEDGVRALEDLRSQDYDVVALDVQMPHINGYDCAREIRLLPKARQPRLLVALTAQTFDDDRERAIAAGFDRFISKPFTTQDLAQVLTEDAVEPDCAGRPRSDDVAPVI